MSTPGARQSKHSARKTKEANISEEFIDASNQAIMEDPDHSETLGPKIDINLNTRFSKSLPKNSASFTQPITISPPKTTKLKKAKSKQPKNNKAASINKEISAIIDAKDAKIESKQNLIQNLHNGITCYNFEGHVIEKVPFNLTKDSFVLVESREGLPTNIDFKEKGANPVVIVNQASSESIKVKPTIKRYGGDKKQPHKRSPVIKRAASIPEKNSQEVPKQNSIVKAGTSKRKKDQTSFKNSLAPRTDKKDDVSNFKFYATAPRNKIYVKIKKNRFTSKLCKRVSDAIMARLANIEVIADDKPAPSREYKPGMPKSKRILTEQVTDLSGPKRSIKLVASSDEEPAAEVIKPVQLPSPSKLGENFFKNKYSMQPRVALKTSKSLILKSDDSSSSDDYLSLSKNALNKSPSINLDGELLSESANYNIKNSQNHQVLSSSPNKSDNFSLQTLGQKQNSSDKKPLLYFEPIFNSSDKNDSDTSTILYPDLSLRSPRKTSVFGSDFKSGNITALMPSLSDSDGSSGYSFTGPNRKNLKVGQDSLVNQLTNTGLEIGKLISDEYVSSDEIQTIPNITSKSLRPSQKIRKKPTYSELVQRMKEKASSSSDIEYTYISDSFDDIEEPSQPQVSTARLSVSSREPLSNYEVKKTRFFNRDANQAFKSRVRSRARRGCHSQAQGRFKQRIRYPRKGYDTSESSSEQGDLSGFIVSDDEIIQESGVDYYNNKQFTSLPTLIQQKPTYQVAENSENEDSNHHTILQSYGISTGYDFQTFFSGYAQYMTHQILNSDILDMYDSETLSYFRRSEEAVERKIQSIKDSLVSSAAWNAQFLKDIVTLPVFYDMAIAPEPGCEVCSSGRSRVSRFIVYLMGSKYLTSLYKNIKDSRKLGFDVDRRDLAYYRFKDGKLSPSILANLNIISFEVKSKIDSGELRYFTPTDVLNLKIYGVCYKMGRFCYKRSKLYHYLHHYGYNLAKQLTNEIENSYGSVELAGLGLSERIEVAENIVGKLDQEKRLNSIYEDLVQTLDSAIEL